MRNQSIDFDEIYLTIRPKIYFLIARYIGEFEAEDLTQEVFIKVYKKLKSFKGKSKISTWIYRIAVNAALDRIRSNSVRQNRHISLDSLISENFHTSQEFHFHSGILSAEQKIIKKEMGQIIRDQIEQLPDKYKSVFILSEMENRKNKDIAESLGISVSNVKIRIHRAKKMLGNMLRENSDLFAS